MSARPGWKAIGAVFFVFVMVTSPVASVAAVSPTATSGTATDAATVNPVHEPQPASATSDRGPHTSGGGVDESTEATDADTESPALEEGPVNPGKLSTAVKYQLSQTNDAEHKIPVIVVLDTQPGDAYSPRELDEAGPGELQSFATEQQETLLEYLEERRTVNEAADIRSFWVVNAIAVEATPETILNLTKSDDVNEVIYDAEMELHGASSNSTISRFADRLSKYGNVTAATPEGYELSNTGERARGVEFIGADNVQERGVTGTGVNVSIIDTGIDADHPGLQDNVLLWKDFTNENSSTATDPIGHGTHVAGTVAGGPDSRITTGVAPDANLFGARIFNNNTVARLSWTLASFEWSAENQADIVQGSFGVPPLEDPTSGSTQVEPSTTATTEVAVEQNATAAFEDDFNLSKNVSSQLEAFEPAYVYVVVEPTAVNGTSIENATVQRRAMRNLTVNLSDPQGQESLERVEAGWWFLTDEVPEEIGFWKFNPTGSQPVPAGNWTLSVTNRHGENVTYRFDVVPFYPTNGSDLEAEAADNLADQGVIPVFSAGNSGILGNRSMGSPAAGNQTIAVGASLPESKDVAVFSSRGPVGFDQKTRPGVDLIAPGVSVLSTTPLASSIFGTHDAYTDAYGSISGTSMAAPHVSGTAALILDAAEDEGRSPSVPEVRHTLKNNAQSVGGPHGENDVGTGLLDAWQAVNSTTNLMDRQRSTEAGVHELHAGVGGTGDSSFISFTLPAVMDPPGDSSGGPDIRAVSRDITDEFELATYNETPANATFEIYIDIDQNDTTGDSTQGGAEYLIIAERTYHPGNQSFELTLSEYEVDGATYVATSNVTTGAPGTVQGNFIEFFGIDIAGHDRIEDSLEWHVVATDGTSQDVAPDSGQVPLPMQLNETGATGVAVAWNATAGTPDVGTSVTFKLANQSGTFVVNRTVTTDENGFASVDFPVPVSAYWRHDDYTLIVSDEYGNEIQQDLRVDNSRIEFQFADTSNHGTLTNDVHQRSYEINNNETLDLNIPVYNETASGLVPYTGSASIRIERFGAEPILINDITVSDGVIRTSVDFSQHAIDDDNYFLDVDVALESNISTASTIYEGGDIFTTERTTATLAEPFVQTVDRDASADLTFQHSRDGEPANVSVRWEAIWITDREVRALYDDLPASTVSRLEKIRRSDTETVDDAKLTKRDGREIREAVRNLSEIDDVSISVTTGTAPPVRNGMGQFAVQPPEDARYGFVFAAADTEDGVPAFLPNFVLVEDRLGEFQRTQTEPAEDDEYFLAIDGDWGEHLEGDWIVPDDAYEVRVSLYNTTTGERVGGETVHLYSSAGETTTITTDASGDIVVNMSAPDVDWRTVGFDRSEQQVVGIVEGLNNGDGTAVSNTEFLFEYPFHVGDADEDEIMAIPELTASGDGSLTVNVSYVNESFDPVSGSKTLALIGTPDAEFSIGRDILVDYVDPGSDTEISFGATDTSPPTTDEWRQYEAAVRTASQEFTWDDYGFVSGARVSVDAPTEIATGQQSTVTITVEDRTGQPIQGAAVVWSYVTLTDAELSDGPGLLDTTGSSVVGVTDSNGEVSFTVAPELESSGQLFYETRLATSNVSLHFVPGGGGEIDVTEHSTVTVTGQVFENDSDPAANDTIAVFIEEGPNAGHFGGTLTNSTGHFVAEIPEDEEVDIQYYQFQDTTGSASIDPAAIPFPQDGSVDLFALERVNTTAPVDLGSTTLPEGYNLNVTVVDENGEPVENATVGLQQHRSDSAADAGISAATNADGMLELNETRGPGLEVSGDVTVTITPPQDSSRFKDESYHRSLTVSSKRDITVTLDERNTSIQQAHGITTSDSRGTSKVVGIATNKVLTFDNGTNYEIQLINEDTGGSVTLAMNGSIELQPDTPLGVIVYSGDGTAAHEPRLWPSGRSDPLPADVVNGSIPTGTGLKNFSVALLNANDGSVINRTGTHGAVLNYSGDMSQNSTNGTIRISVSRDVVPTSASATFVLRNESGFRATYPMTYDASSDTFVTDIDTADLSPGNYSRWKTVWSLDGTRILQYGGFSSDKNVTVTDTEETAGKSTTVSVDPQSDNVAVSDATTFDVVVDTADGGVGAHTTTIELSNATVANITGVQLHGNPGVQSVNFASDNSSVTIDTALMDTNDTGAVTIVTITVEGSVGGETGVNLNISALGDESGADYDVTGTNNATLNVTAVPIIGDFENPPTDPDGDGLYEDINGNGDANIVDVQAMFANRDDSALVDHPEFFDFSGNGDVDIVDVQALFAELSS